MIDSGYVHRLRPGSFGQPILIALHGMGGDENSFFRFAGRLLPEATVVTPRGDILEDGKARYYRRHADGRWDINDLDRATEKLCRFIGELAAEHGASGILALGYSNGANMLAHLLIHRSDLFDAAALLHPSYACELIESPRLAGRRILITTGEKDEITPADDARTLAAHFLKQKAEVDIVVHGGGHDLCSDELQCLRIFFAANPKP